MLRSASPVDCPQGRSLSSHPPFRLRVTLALVVVVVAGTLIGAAVALGSNQDPPATVEAVALEAPPSAIGGIDLNPAAAERGGSGMRLGVLDKDEALQEQRDARNARVGEALRALAAAQEAAIIEYAAALDAAAADDVAPAPSGGGGGGGGGGPTPPIDDGGDGLSLYEKLDRIAICESGGNPRAVSADRRFFGAFQFLLSTWHGIGRPGNPIDHSYEYQREAAADLARAAGFDSWPTCGAPYY